MTDADRRELDAAVAKALGIRFRRGTPHTCPDWDEMWLEPDAPEQECCTCAPPFHDSPEIQAAILRDCEERGWPMALATQKDEEGPRACCASVSIRVSYAPTYAETLARAWLSAKESSDAG